MVVVKPGTLVRYKEYPHCELHASGMTGLVISDSYILDEPGWIDASPVVDVIWNMDRGISNPAGTVTWDYVDEIEDVNE